VNAKAFFLIRFLAALVFTFAPLLPASGDDSISQAELVRRARELFDAVGIGNPEPWKKYFADDCLFSTRRVAT
jgi:hypothetical protein